jgi:acyl carrier protein phosphodiesterase
MFQAILKRFILNFLAHTYLSGDDDDLKIGNFLGDFVKGRLNKLSNSQYPEGIIKGMALHREIDFFTDSHPIVRKSIDRLQPKYHKVSGIVVDMFYDHVLAKNFALYSFRNLQSKVLQLIRKT